MSHPIQILERYWNYTSFRPLQEEIIQSVLNNEDTFVLLPTGGGKSICYQIPALLKDGICIVISPLISLMKDQVNDLKSKGIKAIALTSGISYNELDTLLDNCIYGNYKFLYLSPERLQQDIVKNRIEQMNVNLIAVDEAHCISQWGNDFRPAYKNIIQIRQLHPSVNIIALTATAKPKVVNEIIKELDFITPKLFKASFNRTNIALRCIETEDKHYAIEHILKQYSGSSIIYTRSRKSTIHLHDYLKLKGFKSTFYHGGINNQDKEERLELWSQNQIDVMVATTAFGMGINKPDVRSIIHTNLPESIESYYQEVGRAGRDDKEAAAFLLVSKADEDILINQFINTLPDITFIKLVYRKLCNYFQISYGEGQLTTHPLNFNTFCNTYDFKTSMTFNVLQLLDRSSIIKLSQQFSYQTSLKFIVSNTDLIHYLDKNKNVDIIVKSILRTYGGLFEHELKVNIGLIATKAATSEETILNALHQLHKDEIALFKLANTDSEITFLQPREDDKTINRIAKLVEQQQGVKKQQINDVLAYIKNDTVCKNVQLLNYFGEVIDVACEKCSVCLSKKRNTQKPDLITIQKEIRVTLEQSDKTSRALLEELSFPKEDIIKTLQLMVEHDQVELTLKNTYKIKH